MKIVHFRARDRDKSCKGNGPILAGALFFKNKTGYAPRMHNFLEAHSVTSLGGSGSHSTSELDGTYNKIITKNKTVYCTCCTQSLNPLPRKANVIAPMSSKLLLVLKMDLCLDRALTQVIVVDCIHVIDSRSHHKTIPPFHARSTLQSVADLGKAFLRRRCVLFIWLKRIVISIVVAPMLFASLWSLCTAHSRRIRNKQDFLQSLRTKRIADTVPHITTLERLLLHTTLALKWLRTE